MRYQRQTVLDYWGENGQEKIESSTVYVAGAGGLGGYVLSGLARFGFGHIHVVDNSKVSLSNQNRQILYTDKDIGSYKADLVEERLSEQNPHIQVSSYRSDLESIDIEQLTPRPDIIVSCLDNNQARFALHEKAYKSQVPIVNMAVSGMYGLVLTSLEDDPCLFCASRVLEEDSPIPAIASTVGTVASIGLNETVKYILGVGHLQRSKILYIDLDTNEVESIGISKSKNCKIHKGEFL